MRSHTSPTKPERLADAPPPKALPPPRFVDYLLFLPFVIAFLLVLLIFDLTQRIAFLFGRSAHARAVNQLNHYLLYTLQILRIKVEIKGLYPLEAARPYIIVSNHQSLIDIPILHCLYPERAPKFIAKKELAYGLPTVSFNLRNGKNCLIDRKDPEQAVGEITKFAQLIEREKMIATIFPEGTRARDGRLKRFRPTGLMALLDNAPSAQIIPVTIEGSWMLQARRWGPVPVGATIHVIVHPLLKQEDFRGPLELCRETQKSVERDLTSFRRPSSPDAPAARPSDPSPSQA